MDAFDKDWDKFNDVNKVMIRQQMRTEYKVTFPRLCNSLPRSIHLSPYHAPKNVYIRTDDLDLPACYFAYQPYLLTRRHSEECTVHFSVTSSRVNSRGNSKGIAKTVTKQGVVIDAMFSSAFSSVLGMSMLSNLQIPTCGHALRNVHSMGQHPRRDRAAWARP